MRHALWTCLTLLLCLGLLAGCDEGADTPSAVSQTKAMRASAGNDFSRDASGMAEQAGRDTTRFEADADAEAPRGGRGAVLPLQLPGPGDARRIIFNADVDLVVDDFAGVPGRVAGLADRHGGFVAESAVHGSAGEPRYGTWTLRIPAASFDKVMRDAEALGQVRAVRSRSEEVTAEFTDLQARLRNKQAEEQRLTRHLAESTGDLEDILRVERELSRVRGEVEVYQGRLNVLTDLTSMSTVTVRVEEIKDYVPVATEEPGFTAQAGRAWGGSLSALGGAARGTALFVVALVPWLVVVVPGTLAGWWLVRRGRGVRTRRAA